MRRTLFLLLLLTQDASALSVSIRSATAPAWPEVQLLVRVADVAGKPMPGVRAEHLVARIGDREASVDDVRPMQGTPDGIDIVLVIDASGTMAGTPIEDARSAAADLVRGSMADDRIAVFTFNDDVEVVVDLVGKTALTESTIAGIETGGQQSVLYKSIVHALRLVRDNGRVGRRAIVVVSDGQDESIGAYTLEDCVELAREADIPVFSLGLHSVDGERRYLDVLEKLAAQTGGEFSRVTTTSDLKGLYRQIYTRLRQFYMVSLSASSELGAGRQHGIELNVAVQGRSGRGVAAVSVPAVLPVQDEVPVEVPEPAWIVWGIPAAVVVAIVSGGGTLAWWLRRRAGTRAAVALPLAQPLPTTVAEPATHSSSASTVPPSPAAAVPQTAPGQMAPPPRRARGQTIVAQSRPQVWAHLVTTVGPHANTELALWSDRVQIGSRPGNDIILQDDTVSGQHAMVTRSREGVDLADRESTNGTFVNDRRIRVARVTDGDRIRLGRYEYVLRVVSNQAMEA